MNGHMTQYRPRRNEERFGGDFRRFSFARWWELLEETLIALDVEKEIWGPNGVWQHAVTPKRSAAKNAWAERNQFLSDITELQTSVPPITFFLRVLFKSCPYTFLLLFSSSPIEGLLADTMNTIILLSNQHSTFTYRISSDPYQEWLLSPFYRGR